MHDSAFNLEPYENTSLPDDAPPEFGLVDVIEAFTALRHELREQIRESRASAEAVHGAAKTLQELESKLLAGAAEGSTDESRRLAELIADVDHQLTRSIAAVEQTETNRRRREESETHAVRAYFEKMNPLARWLARPLLTFVLEQRRNGDQREETPAVEGLNLLLARLRRTMKELHIERVDTQGQPFEANSMNAIGTVESSEIPPGAVAEQLAPCYRWHGRILRYADVRVTAQPSAEKPADDENS